MTKVSRRYRAILRQAQQLLLHTQRKFAEALLRPTTRDEQVVFVMRHRFGPERQTRCEDLMDRHNEGQLSISEREEFKVLVARYEALMLLNAEYLLGTAYPELFNASGRLQRRELEQTLRQRPRPIRSSQSK